MIKNTGQYLANKDIYKQYLQSRNKAKFREEHRAEITLYEAARKFLLEESDGKKLPLIKQLKEEKTKLTALKNHQYEEYSDIKARHRQIQSVNQNVHVALGILQNKEKEHDRTQSKIQKSRVRKKTEQSI